MELIPLYLSHIEAEGRRPATIVHYGETLRRFEAWLLAAHGLTLIDQNIERVSGLLLSEYVQMLYANGLKISTRNNYIIVLKEFFEFMNGAGVIRGNPSSVLHCAKDSDKKEMEAEEVDQKAYTPEEISRLLLSIESRNPHMNDARDRAIIALFLGSAMRATEVCQLNLAHAEQIRKGSVYCQRKGGHWKNIEVADFVYPHIARYLEQRGSGSPEEPLFLSASGARLNRKALWKSMATRQKQAQLATGLHIFRHTVLSAVDHGGGSALARDVGGHKSVATTNRYVHTSKADRHNAVNSTPFGALLSQAAQK